MLIFAKMNNAQITINQNNPKFIQTWAKNKKQYNASKADEIVINIFPEYFCWTVIIPEMTAKIKKAIDKM